MLLTEKIMSCSACKGDERVIVSPFGFKIRKQPIMIISACPSIQTVFKPITSVRFFRQLCVSLLGVTNISEEALKEFNTGSIYWTHYHKCYFSKTNEKNGIYNLPDKCASEFIRDELLALKKNLKIIIVVGEIIHKKIDKLIKETGIDYKIVYYVDFPHREEKESYIELENIIKPYLSNQFKGENLENFDHYQHYTILNEVHIDFEYEMIKQFASAHNIFKYANIDYKNRNVNNLWYDRVAMPLKDKQMFIIQCFAFIENQIKAFLYTRINDRKLKVIIDDLAINERFESITGKERFNYAIQTKWQCVIKEYFIKLLNVSTYSYIDLKNCTEAAIEQVHKLRKIRNLLVHEDGFIKPNGDYFDISERQDNNIKKYLFDGMYVFVNLLYIDEKGCKEVFGLLEELMSIIKRIEQIK